MQGDTSHPILRAYFRVYWRLEVCLLTSWATPQRCTFENVSSFSAWALTVLIIAYDTLGEIDLRR